MLEFTADDLGLDESTNLAIEDAHRHGALTSASLMLGQPGTDHGVKVAKRNPRLRVGWHVHVCDSIPLTRPAWPWGTSPAWAGLSMGLWYPAYGLLRREVAAQWRGYLATGLKCHFVNGHHHLHIHPLIGRVIRRTANNWGWVRGFDVRYFPLAPHRPATRWLKRAARHGLNQWPGPKSDTLWGLDRCFSMNAEEIRHAIPSLPPGHHEFLFHPRGIGDLDHQALIELRGVNS